jgi:hypothetical protein
MTIKRLANLTQPQRLAALLIDCVIVALACRFLFGTFYPPVGVQGFWAYSALLAVLVGSKFVTPFYVKPADAIAYAVPAFVSLMLVNNWESWPLDQRLAFTLAAGFSLVIIFLGIGNIVANSLQGEKAKEFSNQLRTVLDLIARPQFVYTPLILFAVFSYHSGSWTEAVTILIVSGLTVVTSAGDFTLSSLHRLRSIRTKGAVTAAGEVVAFQDPGVVLLRQQREGDIRCNDLLFVADRHGPKKIVVALDYVGRSEGILIRAVELKALSLTSQQIVGPVPLDEHAYRLESRMLDDIFLEEGLSREAQSTIVGIVAPDTTIQRLYFEVVNNADLRTGRLVSAHVGKQKVMYQIVAGLTREEIVQQKNTYGFLRGQAHQIGIWDDQATKFTPCTWLPTMNTPVYLERADSYQINPASIGHFPGSNLHARIKSTAELVTHNTAILGILGIGKSCLAFELVERILADNIKVICLDLTDEYPEQLKEFCYDFSGDALYTQLVGETGSDGKKVVSKNVEEGGNKPTFRERLDAYIERFINEDVGRNLLVFNPSQYEVWRQDSKPYANEASMASLSPTEIAQLFTEAALKACQKRGRVTKGAARVCLVYEEAHSLVPEWNTVVNEGDKAAVNGTARAILQGRKFGLGCLLITQRTANVTKTILNQCNTIFAMRIFDETGKEFLANYIGRDYADSLSAIPERHAVLFGKASSCENPVLIRVNDTEAFRPVFRASHPIPKPVPPSPAPPAQAIESVNAVDPEFDDDIPF